jgi:hypothetical protein
MTVRIVTLLNYRRFNENCIVIKGNCHKFADFQRGMKKYPEIMLHEQRIREEYNRDN